ncbi:SDR family NAD(P)-dependent oxidoreductase [Streptomyces sp. S6]|nr:SDR family NAD(P)-dependent oxidoreductase [Streptomyces sp. S6]
MWAPSPTGPAMHPLLDVIEPADSVDGLTYRTAFAPAHPLIDGHRVGDLRLLPAAAALEMARAAAAHAGYPVPVRLRDVRWLRPLVVTEAAASARTRLRRDGAGLAFTLLCDSGDRLAEGVVETLADDVPEPVPVELIRAALPHRHEGTDLYTDLAGAGLVYGPALRAVEWIASGADEALASLRVPAEAARFAGCALPPALIDGALHTFAVLRDRAAGPAMVPFALAAAEVFGPLPEQVYAHVRAVGPDRYDLTLTDPAGTVHVRLRDLSLRPAPAPRTSDAGPSVTAGPAVTVGPALTEQPVDDLMYLPRWSPAPAEPFIAPGSDTWLIRPSSAAPLAAALATRLGGSVTEIEPEHFVAPAGRPGHVIVLSGPAQGRTDDPAALDLAQERGVLALFRAAKALQRSGAPVRLTVVTEDALSTGTEPVRNPYAASLHGLALSLAQEHPRWRVAVVDRSSADPVSPDVLDVPAGGPYALRAGVLHRRSLVPAAPTTTREAIRHGGVYLILGGAGGLGLELTEWLVRGYRAKVVLVGRSELDADRRDRLRRLDPAGEFVSYRRADATDPAALGEVVTAVRAEYGALHGVVHATIVLRDQTVATMTEDTFRAVLDAKTRTSVALHRALGAADGLDFVLFFSSAVALSGSAGQANYAAGSTFEDAFAHHLDDALAARSAVINWGYWGTVGIVADDRHRERLARTGIHSITPAEGMAAVHDVLGRTDRQVVVIKATAAVLAAAGVERPAAEQAEDELAPSAGALPPVARLLTESDQARLDEVVLGWLWELFRGEGVFRTGGERWSADELRRRLRIADGQSRLFAELLRVLTVAGFLYDGGSALSATDRPAPADPENELVALCAEQPALNRIDRLLRPCMHHLFGVLRGTVRATEVMFPGGSTELVEGAYRGSPVVDRANELVVAASLDRVGRLGGPVTVVEIGAGTGGTTASLLPALAATGAELTYVYTDISPAFLQHGRQRFAERYPMVRFQQLDISGDPLAQGFPPGGADIVVAANVLHATPDLTHTLRAVATLLKPGGQLVLNEASSNVVTATLTFGLLDGWWLHRDTGLRLPGSPLLSGPGWRTALDLAGFARSRAFPADEGLTQHVVVAETGPAGPAPVATPTAEPRPRPWPNRRPRRTPAARTGSSRPPVTMSRTRSSRCSRYHGTGCGWTRRTRTSGRLAHRAPHRRPARRTHGRSAGNPAVRTPDHPRGSRLPGRAVSGPRAGPRARPAPARARHGHRACRTAGGDGARRGPPDRRHRCRRPVPARRRPRRVLDQSAHRAGLHPRGAGRALGSAGGARGERHTGQPVGWLPRPHRRVRPTLLPDVDERGGADRPAGAAVPADRLAHPRGRRLPAAPAPGQPRRRLRRRHVRPLPALRGRARPGRRDGLRVDRQPGLVRARPARPEPGGRHHVLVVADRHPSGLRGAGRRKRGLRAGRRRQPHPAPPQIPAARGRRLHRRDRPVPQLRGRRRRHGSRRGRRRGPAQTVGRGRARR